MDTSKLLGISASPREHGNSRFLLEVALDAAEAVAPGLVETELYSCAGKTFELCDACDLCHEELGYCKIISDDLGELRDKWIEADAVIYSVPIFHMRVPGAFKNFLDRLGNSVVEGFTSKPMKTIGVLTQGTGRVTGQEQVMMYLNGHATMMLHPRGRRVAGRLPGRRWLDPGANRGGRPANAPRAGRRGHGIHRQGSPRAQQERGDLHPHH